MELTKADKRAAREIIEIGLQNECNQGMTEFAAIVDDWKKEAGKHQDYYHSMYAKVINFDKHIASRYDGMRGSNYLLIIAAQLRDGFISETDVLKLSETARLYVEKISRIWMEE